MEIIFVSKGNFIEGISAVAQSRAANLRDLCGILPASASKDLGHDKFLACVGRELIMKRESVEGCFRYLCYWMASRQNNNLWNPLVCHSDKFRWLCPCRIPLCLFCLKRTLKSSQSRKYNLKSSQHMYPCQGFGFTAVSVPIQLGLACPEINLSPAKQRFSNCRLKLQ